MSINISFLAEDGVILLTCSDRLTYRDLQAATGEANEIARSHDCYRFLVDACKMDQSLAVHEIYDFPRFYASLGIPHRARIAVVPPPSTTRPDNFHFYETVCRNAGFMVESFAGVQAAREWLSNRRPSSSGGGSEEDPARTAGPLGT